MRTAIPYSAIRGGWILFGAEGRDKAARLAVPMACLVAVYLVGLFSESMAVKVGAGILGAGIIFVYAFLDTDLLIMALIGSMLLSPEMQAGTTGLRSVTVRLEDFLIFFVFLSWLVRAAVLRESFVRSRINIPIIAFACANIIATIVAGMGRPRILKDGFFFNLKLIEYNLVYFLVANNIRNRPQVGLFLAAFLVTALVTGAIAASQVGTLSRVTAPFEGRNPEPNTLGGYLTVVISVCAGLSLMSERMSARILWGIPALLLYYPLLYTASRSSYAALAMSVAVMLLLYTFWRRKFWWAWIIPVMIFFRPLVIPDFALNRATSFDDVSSEARRRAWALIPKVLSNRPFLGWGVTGVGLVDSQYPRIIAESGVIGFSMFLWLVGSIGVTAYRGARRSMYPFTKGLRLGFIGAFVGVLVHSLGANTFLVIRIMEPFWFLTGLVVGMDMLEFSPLYITRGFRNPVPAARR